MPWRDSVLNECIGAVRICSAWIDAICNLWQEDAPGCYIPPRLLCSNDNNGPAAHTHVYTRWKSLMWEYVMQKPAYRHVMF